MTPGFRLAGDLEVVALIGGVGIELEGHPDVGRRTELAEVESRPEMPMTVYGSPLSEMVLPSMFGSLLKRRCQSRSLTSATFGAFGESSSAENARPRMIGRAEQPEVVDADTWLAWNCSGTPPPAKLHAVVAIGGDVLDDGGLRRASGRTWRATRPRRRCRWAGMQEDDEAVRLGERRGFSSTAFTTEKIAVLAPMPRARAATAAT